MSLPTLWTLYGPFWIADYYTLLQWSAGFFALVILISSIDDVFIDVYFWVREVWRSLTVKRRYPSLTVAQLMERDEQPIAIMIPAWHEYDVIAAMVENMVETLDYENYAIFVGTYPNDAQTIAEVERMRRRYKHLHRVEVPHEGPTCKADCLNWVIQAIFLKERENGTPYAGVVLHDSEDVLHALELRFFNYLLPRKDMVQLPVASLERSWYEFVAGTYMDEFAEWHAKDLVVRESLTGSVPSAGVGTCFSHRAMHALADATNQQPFNTDSLTEDYDVGARLSKLGMRSIFARFPVRYQTRRKTWFGLGPAKDFEIEMPLCVREFFPDTVRTAYRQKARWTLGIGLQSWQQLGWSGSLAARYLLFRDRKGVVTAFVGVLAYVLVLQFALFYFANVFGWLPVRFPPLFAPDGVMRWVFYANLIALFQRVSQRIIFVKRLYGWEHALLSVPRMAIGNFINFLAVARAWRMFLTHLVTGRRLVWDKTMHDFPSADQLIGERRRLRLGELLLSWRAISNEQLERGLNRQSRRDLPLGRALIADGAIDEETLAEAISYQSELPRVHVDMARLRRERERTTVPVDFQVRWRAIDIGSNETGDHWLAVAAPLPPEALATLPAGIVWQQGVARESEIAAGLRVLRGDPSGTVENAVPLLGDLLIEMGLLARRTFEKALEGYRPERDGRIGDHLVRTGVLEPQSVERALLEQRHRREGQVGA
ncbi:glycosyl transferase family protein [Chitinasiproducens palmae]|uniref:Adsorption protein B n=1 Tax=Chitinasiproducens palmae TaxID=1770053 RepID=A0A1H2PJL3_9BURK|nr:glycosyl transferase family protein [Chitinasiproducens palmae]SDV46542.1 adsorption protein B [Chitinasiproducens palmae]